MEPTLNYLGLMLATRVGPSFGHEPVVTPPEQPEPADFSLVILLLMATIFGWWLRGLIGMRLQRISAGSSAWPFSGWTDFSRSSGSMSEGPDEVPQGIQEDCFSPHDFHQGWKRASIEGTEGTTMLQTSNQVPALMSYIFGTLPR